MGNVIYADYAEYKKELDMQLNGTVEGFVRIGFLLKMARDTDILSESGYKNVNDFAMGEYSLDKTQVSRFIRINDRFSEDGNSDTLQEQYRGFGYAKLSIMLQLPDEVNGILTDDLSKADIQRVKEEVDAERGITDIEVMLEEPDGQVPEADDLGMLDTVLYQTGKENPGLYGSIWLAVKNGVTGEELAGHMAPSGSRIYSVRIPGTGRVMLSVSEDRRDIEIVNIRTGEKSCHGKKKVVERLEQLCGLDAVSPEAAWEQRYGEKYPSEPEEEYGTKKPKEAKKPKVIKSKTEKKKKDRKDKKKQETGSLQQKDGMAADEEKEEESTDVVLDTGDAKTEEVAPVQPETEEKPETDMPDGEAFKTAVTNGIQTLEKCWEDNNLPGALEAAKDICRSLEKLMIAGGEEEGE